jgi:hypothetical protein
MRKIFCPNCDGNNVFRGEDRVLILLGLLTLSVATLCLVTSFPGPFMDDWVGFKPVGWKNTIPGKNLRAVLEFVSPAS